MAVINVDDIYILDETGAQVDKVTGLFTKDEDTTSGEKAFAQLNIGTAGSNRNLLDNPWFTVRQRGDGPFNSGGYTVDRWKIAGGAPTITPIAGYGVNISQTTNTAFDQMIDPALMTFCNGKTLTLSVYTSAGIFTGTGVLNTSTSAYSIRFNLGSTGFRTGVYNATTSYWFVRIDNITSGATINLDVYAVKLEIGSVSTLANDVPQNDELECLKYQYLIQNGSYNYVPIGFGSFVNGNTVRVFIPTGVPMNAASMKSAVAMTGAVTISGNGVTTTVTAMTLVSVLRTGVYVNVTTSTALTTSHTYTVMLGDSASILLDCNL